MNVTELADAIDRRTQTDETHVEVSRLLLTQASHALRRLAVVEAAARTALNDAEHLAPSDFAFVKHQTRGAFDALRAALRAE